MPEVSDENRYLGVHPDLRKYIKLYDEWSEKAVNAEQASDAIPQPLYHYTSMAGLLGMLQTETFWFTDYKHQNDPSEVNFGINSFTNINITPNSFDDCYFKYHVDSIIKSDIIDQELFFFISCFTNARNNLGMWRAYAENGHGVSIGLSPSLFAISDSPRPQCNSELGAYVRYGTHKLKTRHKKALIQAHRSFRLALQEHASLLNDEKLLRRFTRELALRVLALPVMWNCLTSKDEAYRSESEYRLAIVGSWIKPPRHLTARLRGDELVPYIAQPVPLRARGVITEIIIGPAAPKDSVRTVRNLLTSLGMDWEIPIAQSLIPYRAL